MIEFAKELWDFTLYRKKFWLTPIVVVLGDDERLIVATQCSALAPFIYQLW